LRHLVRRHHVIGQPLPYLVLAEQFDAEIAAQSELLAIRAQRHFGMVDRAIPGIEDAAVLVNQSGALHAFDDGEAERRRILLVASAMRADRVGVFAGFKEHLGDGAFVNAIILEDQKPAANPAVLVHLRPHAGGGGLAPAQRDAIGQPGHQTGNDQREDLQLHSAAPKLPQGKHALYMFRQCVLFTESNERISRSLA
jgi:hypothetical protein